MNSYEILGLSSGATEQEVKDAYKKLAIKYNINNYESMEEQNQASRKMEEIDAAFDEVINYLRTGIYPNANQNVNNNFYAQVRQYIQNGEYTYAIQLLNDKSDNKNAQWNFLMGSALYYGNYISQSYQYFAKAAELEPNNTEYTSTFNRINQSRQGNVYGSPFSNTTTYTNVGCCDPCCTLCQCLVCFDCCCCCR